MILSVSAEEFSSSGVEFTLPEKVVVEEGHEKKLGLRIQNQAGNRRTLLLQIENMHDFVTFPNGLQEDTLDLAPHQEVILPLTITIPLGATAGVYAGIIHGTDETVKTSTPFLVEVKPMVITFDAELTIPAEKTIIPSDGQINSILFLLNTAGRGKKSLTIQYMIRDFSGNEYPLTSETVTVETTLSLAHTFPFPPDLPPGSYVLVATITDHIQPREISTAFTIQQAPATREPIGLMLIGVIAFFLLLFFAFLIARSHKHTTRATRSYASK